MTAMRLIFVFTSGVRVEVIELEPSVCVSVCLRSKTLTVQLRNLKLGVGNLCNNG